MSNYLLSADIGQMSDFTALSVLETIRSEGNAPVHKLVHLERLRLRTPYPEVVRTIAARFETVKQQDRNATLIIDVTGVGRGVVDLLRESDLEPIAITIHGGSQTLIQGTEYHIPKKDLITAAQVALQQRRLRVAPELKDAATLQNELLNFRYKINLETANMQYEAWREGIHDDLCLSVACAVWYANQPGAYITVLDGFGQPAGQVSQLTPLEEVLARARRDRSNNNK